jgi:hypothetical protein
MLFSIAQACSNLKDNKAAGSESIAVELIKSGRPSLVNAFSRFGSAKHYLKSEPRGTISSVHTRRAINLIARIITASAY